MAFKNKIKVFFFLFLLKNMFQKKKILNRIKQKKKQEKRGRQMALRVKSDHPPLFGWVRFKGMARSLPKFSRVHIHP